jgi:hypothetical protein
MAVFPKVPLMRKPPPNPKNRVWWLAVFIFAIAAVIVVRIFRPMHADDEKAQVAEPVDTSTISTQVLSFQLDGKAELDSVADESGSIWMKNRPERPGAAIVHSDPTPAQLEAYKKERNLAPTESATDLNKPGVPIQVE